LYTVKTNTGHSAGETCLIVFNQSPTYFGPGFPSSSMRATSVMEFLWIFSHVCHKRHSGSRWVHFRKQL